MLYIKDGLVQSPSSIVVIKDGMQIINPTIEDILSDGWVEYVAPPIPPKLEPYSMEIVDKALEVLMPSIKDQVKTLDDQSALNVMVLFDSWASKIGKQVEAGDRLYYDDKLYKVRQGHTVQEIYPPSVDTASLYEEIAKEASGTVDDPIPYNNNMELFEGKYYSQDGVVYKCTRSTGTAVYNPLSSLVRIYVEVAA